MNSRLEFTLRALRSKLWIKPLGYAVLAVGAVFLARTADGVVGDGVFPNVSTVATQAVLGVISASMLGVATFAVASMVSAYASASTRATPRVFTLIVADRMSQKALSTFIGAFIFSVVGTVALHTEYFGEAGRFVLFTLSLLTIAWVVLTFVRWVDGIARLGRMGDTIERVEEATFEALATWRPRRSLGAMPASSPPRGEPIESQQVGYVQHVDVQALQELAEEHDAAFHVNAPPGSFVSPDRPLLHASWKEDQRPSGFDDKQIEGLFVLSHARTFTQDPRLGFIALGEIACRALSPAVNDPGTAIEIVGRHVRLMARWRREVLAEGEDRCCERVFIPVLRYEDVLDDAFQAVAREGAGTMEVAVWIQKSLAAIQELGDDEMATAAARQASLALERAEASLTFPADIERLREAAGRSE